LAISFFANKNHHYRRRDPPLQRPLTVLVLYCIIRSSRTLEAIQYACEYSTVLVRTTTRRSCRDTREAIQYVRSLERTCNKIAYQ